MRKTILATALLATLGTGSAIAADAPASPHTLTGNAALVSEYRFRGIDQTFGEPAVQVGFDYSHSSGLYVGNWNSNVSSGAGFPNGNLEMDFYGGYKLALGDFGLDLGAIYYYYPGSEANGLTGGRNTGEVNNQEVYLGASYKFISAKISYSLDDYFSLTDWDSTGTLGTQGTKGTIYSELNAAYDLGGGFGINAHVGYLDLKNGYKGSYTDIKVGVTKDFGGWVLGLAYVGTDAAGECTGATDYQFYCFANTNTDDGAGNWSAGGKFKDAGRDTAVLSLTKSF